jgi:large subunit ribosomal protein L25
MEAQTLSAEVRHKGGKGPARQLRMRGLIPAIFYGPKTEPVKLAVSPADLMKLLSGPFGRNQIIEVGWGGQKQLAVVKDLAIDPLTRVPLHVDLYGVARDRKLETIVPFETQGRALGVQKGGFLHKLFRELPVRAFPQDVPSTIVLDVAPFDIGSIVKVGDLPLPSGVEVIYPPERRVVLVEAKERKRAEAEEEAAPTPAAATPAATT